MIMIAPLGEIAAHDDETCVLDRISLPHNRIVVVERDVLTY